MYRVCIVCLRMLKGVCDDALVALLGPRPDEKELKKAKKEKKTTAAPAAVPEVGSAYMCMDTACKCFCQCRVCQ